MHWLDWLVVAGYFGTLLALAWWVIRKNRETADDYFLAGRNLAWWIVGASIFASNIGSEHLVGLAGSGATDGVAMAHYELHAWCLLILGWVFVPFYMRSKIFTMPEFLEKRFSPSSRWVLSIISLMAYVLTKIAVGIFAGGIVFSVLLPELRFGPLDSFWIGSILVIVLTGLYTIIGGLRAVAYTEALQTVVLVLGSVLVTAFGLEALGGWSALREIAGSEMFDLWKPLVPDGVAGTWQPVREVDAGGQVVRMAWYFNDNYPWLSMLFCAPVIGLWYWCTDQYIVQRALGAPNEQQARRGSIFAAFLKLLPVFIFIIPGIIAFALAKSGGIAEIQQTILDANGEVIIATLFTMDFYSKLRPNVSQHRLVWIGRTATTVMVLIGLAWIPVIQGGKGLYDYLQGVQAYLAPPIFVVFFLGVFFKRLNAQGALATLVVGFLLGLFRLAIDTPVKLEFGRFEGGYTEGSFLWIVNNMFFQYYSIVIFLVCVAVMVGVSHATREPDYARISGLTFGTITDAQRSESRRSWGWNDVVASVAVLVAIVVAYLYFTG
jgi:SSS family solute:Na+ symporter